MGQGKSAARAGTDESREPFVLDDGTIEDIATADEEMKQLEESLTEAEKRMSQMQESHVKRVSRILGKTSGSPSRSSTGRSNSAGRRKRPTRDSSAGSAGSGRNRSVAGKKVIERSDRRLKKVEGDLARSQRINERLKRRVEAEVEKRRKETKAKGDVEAANKKLQKEKQEKESQLKSLLKRMKEVESKVEEMEKQHAKELEEAIAERERQVMQAYQEKEKAVNETKASLAHVSKEGYLKEHTGRVLKRWEKRWVLLKSNFLLTFKDPTNISQPLQVINFENALFIDEPDVSSLGKSVDASLVVEVHIPNFRSYYFLAETTEERDVWLGALQGAKDNHSNAEAAAQKL